MYFKRGDVIIIRQFAPVEDGVKEVRKEVQDIAIPSLKVIGLGEQNKLALTAPVYVNTGKGS